MPLRGLSYLTPLLPLVTRAGLIVRFRTQMRDVLTEPEQDRESNRTLILAFAGFSFTGVIALILLEPRIQQTVQKAVFFLLVSFLTYLWAFNLQGYKALRWQAEGAAGLIDAGSFCLVLALVSLLLHSTFPLPFVLGTSLLALVVWGVDQITRLRIDYSYHLEIERKIKSFREGLIGHGHKEESSKEEKEVRAKLP